MPWAVVVTVAAAAYSAEMQARAARKGRPPVEVKPREKQLEEIAREHRRKMEAEHVETMRGAKVGTWLLGALFVVVVYAAAQIAGLAP